MFGTKKSPILTISEPDLQGALVHLRSLPFAPPMPVAWDRKWLLEQVREAVGKSPKVGDSVQVAPGVYALITTLAADLAGWDAPNGRLQVWLCVRGWFTDPDHLTEL